MAIAVSTASLLSSMEQAEKDLALYAAIIGCRPSLDPVAEQSASPAPPPTEIAAPEPELIAHPAAPGRISVWMHHVSDAAKKRIHEARTRLAS